MWFDLGSLHDHVSSYRHLNSTLTIKNWSLERSHAAFSSTRTIVQYWFRTSMTVARTDESQFGANLCGILPVRRLQHSSQWLRKPLLPKSILYAGWGRYTRIWPPRVRWCTLLRKGKLQYDTFVCHFAIHWKDLQYTEYHVVFYYQVNSRFSIVISRIYFGLMNSHAGCDSICYTKYSTHGNSSFGKDIPMGVIFQDSSRSLEKWILIGVALHTRNGVCTILAPCKTLIMKSLCTHCKASTISL
jgi:hypothetical protein